jgi:ADP-ribose pyrophosphatase
MPVTPQGTVFLFHQTKYAVPGTTLAPVGGHIEPGEEPLAAAKRELREEMGCEASDWIFLGNFPNNANQGGGYGNLYLALNARKVGEPIIDDLEEMELIELTPLELEERLLQGEVKCMGWAAMFGIGLLYLKKQKMG